MEGELALQGLSGKLSWLEDGLRCAFSADASDDGRGLYKIHLHGARESALLGTLVPENGRLSLRRSVSISELRRLGCWPITAAEAVLAFAFEGRGREAPPEGWQRAEHPDDLLPDPVLRHAVRETENLLLRREEQGFCLAAPYGERRPFPMPPLFCLGTLCHIAGRRYILYRFDPFGKPQMPDLRR